MSSKLTLLKCLSALVVSIFYFCFFCLLPKTSFQGQKPQLQVYISESNAQHPEFQMYFKTLIHIKDSWSWKVFLYTHDQYADFLVIFLTFIKVFNIEHFSQQYFFNSGHQRKELELFNKARTYKKLLLFNFVIYFYIFWNETSLN